MAYEVAALNLGRTHASAVQAIQTKSLAPGSGVPHRERGESSARTGVDRSCDLPSGGIIFLCISVSALVD